MFAPPLFFTDLPQMQTVTIHIITTLMLQTYQSENACSVLFDLRLKALMIASSKLSKMTSHSALAESQTAQKHHYVVESSFDLDGLFFYGT